MSQQSEHRWAVEGIDGDIASVEEDGARMKTVAVRLLPAGTKAGQVLRVTGTGDRIRVELDEDATREALAKSAAVVQRAAGESRKRDPGGDVSL